MMLTQLEEKGKVREEHGGGGGGCREGGGWSYRAYLGEKRKVRCPGRM